jgi:hypothetical protein
MLYIGHYNKIRIYQQYVIDKNKRRVIGPVEMILSSLIITFLGVGILFYRLSSQPHKKSE